MQAKNTMFSTKLKVILIVIFAFCEGHAYNKTTTTTIRSGDSLVLEIDGKGGFDIYIRGTLWFRSGDAFFNIDGKIYSKGDGSLSFDRVYIDQGEDVLGSWISTNYMYTAGMVPVEISFKQYRDYYSGFVVFGQTFPSGANNTSVGDKNKLISGFPSFVINGSTEELGYMAYGGIMVAETGRKIGRWTEKGFSITDGTNCGPISVFNTQGDAIFMSPFSQFMSASSLHDATKHTYTWGVMGGVQHIPETFTYSTILYYSSQGINKAISGWGDVMRKYYNKDTSYRYADITLNYLSYWTDNGAYYVNYYVKGGLIQNMTYEEALLGVKEYADKEQIPYRSIQYSVWYDLGTDGGTKQWNSSSLMFPGGVKYMFENIGLPVTAHNRWWTNDVVYAKQNGGKYNFAVEDKLSLPLDQEFWDDMFHWSLQWGFTNLMQDWLNKQFDDMTVTTSDVSTARAWLQQMGEGARRNGNTIQYCMSESRHVLQSLEIPVVTQARASGDYHPGYTQWKIGMSSMLAHAVGIAPFKDTLWTTSVQPDSIYTDSEPYPALQVAVATLSTGPVGPGDMIGATNKSLLMRCCASDGLILKPSKPAMAVDAQIIQESFGGSVGPDGEVWTTFSDISGKRFGIILAVNMKNTYRISSTSAGFGLDNAFTTSKVYGGSINAAFTPPAAFSEHSPLQLTPQCTMTDFCLYYTTPLFYFRNTELLLLGELQKWVPMSPQRVISIQYDEYDFQIKLKGQQKEMVQFVYVYQNKTVEMSCTFGISGFNVISVADKHCSSV